MRKKLVFFRDGFGYFHEFLGISKKHENDMKTSGSKRCRNDSVVELRPGLSLTELLQNFRALTSVRSIVFHFRNAN